MAIFNLGSINIDHTYLVPHLPRPGETLAASNLITGLGGKGANQSIAIARAGGQVLHIGATGPEGEWTAKVLGNAGVDIAHVSRLDIPTGHAIINVDDAAENAIVLFSGANRAITIDMVMGALAQAGPGDWLLLQNETSAGVDAAKLAKSKGLKVAYCAAPFESKAVAQILPFIDLLSVNEGEAASLAADLPDADLGSIQQLITYGAKGAALIGPEGRADVASFAVDPVDTTGAGDTFLGYSLAGFDTGLSVEDAMRRASAAAAIQVTRPGAAEAIPTADEVTAFLQDQA